MEEIDEDALDAKLHPYKTGSNQFSMNPALLWDIGVKIDNNCVVCGKNTQREEVYVDNGYIHCVNCALKHKHITKKEWRRFVMLCMLCEDCVNNDCEGHWCERINDKDCDDCIFQCSERKGETKSCQNCKHMEITGGYCHDCHNQNKWNDKEYIPLIDLREETIKLLNTYKKYYREDYIVIRKGVLDELFKYMNNLYEKFKYAGIEVT